ncbi:MAG: DNA topoisomerase IV subunit A, partial [Mollicutes bacterium PWAP]|nr:DNA topoisomerase IV subunit A [Mollicutes bacterium PWAP]
MEKKENIIVMSLDDVMGDRFGKYSKYIIQDRAIPDSRDGLKPVQRRILFSMNELRLFHDKDYKKSARVVGEVIGKYHPHGDSSIYEAMIRMSQDWKTNMPLIDVHGNNGSIDNDPPAAMRYTEARLSKISQQLLQDIDKEAVRFSPNFDDSEKEPTILPSLFPNLLVNGSRGIAAGYATEMPPHNLIEVIGATIKIIKNPNTKLSTINEIIKGPDFPTGGVVYSKNGIEDALEKGRGKISIVSKYKFENNNIIIDEIPYGVNKGKMVRNIEEISINEEAPGIKEVRDETDRNGLRIFIELEKNASPELVMSYLLKKTDLQTYYNYNNV